MGINKEAQIVRGCFIPRDTRDAKQVRVEKEEIDTYLDENNIESTYWQNIEYCFDQEQTRYCRVCGLNVEFCECSGEPTITSETNLRIIPGNLAERWERWVGDTDIFSHINVDTNDSTPFEASAMYNGKDLTIYVVFSVQEFNSLDLSANRTVFVASFFHDTEINQKQNVIPWSNFIDSGFRKELRKRLKALNKVYSANIANSESISDFDDEVFHALESALEQYGFTPLVEPGKIDIADEYKIDTSKASLGFKRGDWEGLLCDCDKSNELHFHLFQGEDIISVAEDGDIETSIKTLRQKIHKYRKIERFKRYTRAKGTVASAVAALFTALVLALNFAPVRSYLDSYVPISQNIGLVSTVLLGISVLIIVAYTLAVFGPFIYELVWFDWDVTED